MRKAIQAILIVGVIALGGMQKFERDVHDYCEAFFRLGLLLGVLLGATVPYIMYVIYLVIKTR